MVNRGIALYEGKVIAPVVDGRLRALDAMTGEKVWETRVSPDTMPYTITMAPRVIKGGRVIVGVAGGEYGVRGFFDAYDVNTGRAVVALLHRSGRPVAGLRERSNGSGGEDLGGRMVEDRRRRSGVERDLL